MCSLRTCKSCSTAAEMSVPESGSTSVWQDPLSNESWIAMVGAGSAVDNYLMVDKCDGCCCTLVGSGGHGSCIEVL